MRALTDDAIQKQVQNALATGRAKWEREQKAFRAQFSKALHSILKATGGAVEAAKVALGTLEEAYNDNKPQGAEWKPYTPDLTIPGRIDILPYTKEPIRVEHSNGDHPQGKAGARRLLAALSQWYPEGMTQGQLRAHAGLRKSGIISRRIPP